jgi:hypothetical protein
MEAAAMKWFLIFWASPLAFLGAWYGLSYNDISFGFFMLTRETHDLVFQIYGSILGIEPEAIPPLVLRAIIVDTLLVLAILAFRRRRRIMAWWRERYGARERAESLSSAP